MTDIIGLINLREPNPLTELNEDRPLGGVPFGGKFRLIDFTLSSMVNAGIGCVGLLLSDKSRPLMDHIRSGKEWNLARKQEGLFYLPPDEEDIKSPVEGDIRDYYKNLRYVERGGKSYLLLSYSNAVHNIDYEQLLKFHRKHNADVSLVYCKQVNKLTNLGRTLTLDDNDRVLELSAPKDTDPGDNLFLQALLIDCELFIKSIRFAYAHGEHSFFDDVVGHNLKRLRVFGYNCNCYVARIDSVQAYYRASMRLLDVNNWRDLFFRGDVRVHTKIMDEAPTKYMEGAKVTNSLIANGCIIEGVVENSILSRRVHVGRNAVVKNSIVMQHSTIGDEAELDCVICDKNSFIQPEAVLKGTAKKPLCITRFEA